MSQEQPSQPPTPSEPTNQSKIPVKEGVKTPQTTGMAVQSILRSQSIKALRGTIRALEGVLVKLEAQPTSIPSSATRQPWSKIQSVWSAVLGTGRTLLPESLSKLSDTALSGAIAGVAVVLVLTISALSPGKPTNVATAPPLEPAPPASIATPAELTAPAPEEPIEVTPPPSVSAPVLAPEPTPTPTVAPTVELTPEQNLIASVQNEIAEVTNKYADGLIQSIQANFAGSRLTVRVSDNWYSIEQSQQNKLASEMLNQAKQLDFSHLELTDPQGKLLARSPVVGTDMIILKRQA